jgi:conjugative relaxase-like TrwC/TraI family protein
MMTISKPISAGQAQRYHSQEFANAHDNYYTEGSHVRGEWHGKLADKWGLHGEVNEEHFARLSEGQHPFTGEQLVGRRPAAVEYTNAVGEKVRVMEHRAGWDATFSAPKSVSLTALVGGDERLRLAHRESVDVALRELERYVQARISSHGPAETTGQWIAAKFEHDSSRPVDGYAAPQLHTHVVFFNITERKNGETRALQPRELYRSQQYGTAIYRSELALRLKALGYEIEQGKSGQPEIKGYTQEYLEASSPRRQEIKRHLEEVGLEGAGPAQIAAHQTRGAKLTVSHEEMQERHGQMAAAFGHQPERVIREAQQRQMEYAQMRPQEHGQRQQEQAERRVSHALTYAREKNLERSAVADERELLRDALKRSMAEASFEQVRTGFEQRVHADEFIEVQQTIGTPSRAFTTQEMIALERDNIRRMLAGRDLYAALAAFETRRIIEKEHAHLSKSQHNAVQEVLCSRDRVVALEGIAGAGKTTSLAAIRQAAEREGYKVQGFAPTSRAAQKLQEAGIESSTLQKHLISTRQAGKEQKHFYVLDESSLASTKQMNDFLHRLKANDRVLLVGDVRQHQAVEAGSPYQQLQEAGMRTARLHEIVRQKDPALKEAVEQLARGEVNEAIENLEQQGRVHQIEQREERLRHIANEYVRAPQATLVISPDNESRQQLNAFIRTRMQESGQLETGEHKLRVLETRQQMTGADRAWAAQYQPGDLIRYGKASKVLGLKAGEYAKVTTIDREQNRLTIQRENGRRISYDPRRFQGVTVYQERERGFSPGERVQFTAPWKQRHIANRELATVEAVEKNGDLRIRLDSGRQVKFNVREHPHLDHGYAVTSHSSQGQTAERVLIHADTEKSEQLVNRRMAYVAVSRARQDAQIYTNDKSNLAKQLSRDQSHKTATQQESKQEFKQHEPKAMKMEPKQERGPELSQAHGMSR